MNIDELIKLVKKFSYYVYTDENMDYTIITNEWDGVRVEICNETLKLKLIRINIFDVNIVYFLKALITFLKTPYEDRKSEIRYIIPLPGLKTTDGKQQYLSHKDGTFFASRRDRNLRQTWKKQHLANYIPEEYAQYAVEYNEYE